MNKLSRVIAMSIFGISGSAHTAEPESGSSSALTNLDIDGDGYVNFEEYKAGGANDLRPLDSDENGVLTLDEILKNRSGRGPKSRGGHPEREPSEAQIVRIEERRAAMTARAEIRFQEMDVSGNDIISLEEFQEANFLELDSDNNGLLGSEELRPKRGGRRGRGGPRGRPPQV